MTDDRGARALELDAVPGWHPALLVALMLSVDAAGSVLAARHHELRGQGPLVVRAYLPLLCVNWGLLLYVCRVGRARSAFVELMGPSAFRASRALTDLALAVVTALALMGGEAAWQLAFGNARNAAAGALLPTTSAERAVWCAVAVSVGVSEEVVYRGYLTTELARFTGSAVAGVVGQALLFAFAHGEQGAAAVTRFFVYALGLGALARARRSLLPGILAHVAVDLVAGLCR